MVASINEGSLHENSFEWPLCSELRCLVPSNMVYSCNNRRSLRAIRIFVLRINEKNIKAKLIKKNQRTALFVISNCHQNVIRKARRRH